MQVSGMLCMMLVNKTMFQETLEVLSHAVRCVSDRRETLIKVLAIPVILYASLNAMVTIQPGSFGIGVYFLTYLFAAVLAFLTFVFISVATHRTILLSEKSGIFSRIKSVGVREWQFLLAFFEAVFYCLPCMLFLFIPIAGETIAIVAGAYIVSRISLIFPSIAINTPMNARASWQATTNKKFLMFSVVFLFSLFFTTIEWIMSRLGIHDILLSLFSIITVVFLVSALSEAYRLIMNQLSA